MMNKVLEKNAGRRSLSKEPGLESGLEGFEREVSIVKLDEWRNEVEVEGTILDLYR